MSIGFGSNCTNNGIAIGVLTTAETNQPVAIGNQCQAGSTSDGDWGTRSIALGHRAQALGDYIICIGNDSTIDKNISKRVVLGSDFGGAQNSNALYVAKMIPLQDNDVEIAKALYYDLSAREIIYGASNQTDVNKNETDIIAMKISIATNTAQLLKMHRTQRKTKGSHGQI